MITELIFNPWEYKKVNGSLDALKQVSKKYKHHHKI